MLTMIRIVCCIFSILTLNNIEGRPTEQERVELWYKNGNTWPPKWQEESEAFKAAMDIREKEIMSLGGADERWENWMQFTSARMVPHFTEFGFKLIDTPPELHKKLYDEVQANIKNWEDIPYEFEVDAIYHPKGLLPKFVNMGKVAREVHLSLLPLHEEWAGGMKLRPTSAYGVRLYQNGSSLVMHYDKIETHVISSIVHIDHEYDNEDEPWPLEIEDHDGNLHSVNLKKGQMVFYESAKALHGRMQLLKGKYYGSIFLHYAPVDKSIWNFTIEDVIANVPPHWKDGITHDHGARWAGQAITTDSRVTAGAPPRETGPPDDEEYDL